MNDRIDAAARQAARDALAVIRTESPLIGRRPLIPPAQVGFEIVPDRTIAVPYYLVWKRE